MTQSLPVHTEIPLDDPTLAALQNQLSDQKRRLAVACTQMAEYAGDILNLPELCSTRSSVSAASC